MSEILRSGLRCGDVAIELQDRFLNALPRELARRVVRHDAPQHAIGINGDAGGCPAADRVAAATAAAADLGQRRLLHDE